MKKIIIFKLLIIFFSITSCKEQTKEKTYMTNCTELEMGYFITAEIKVKDSTRIELAKKELIKLQELTLKEEGCNFFSIQQDEKNPTRFIMWERFDNEDAFKKHFEYEHTKRYVELDLTEVVQYFQTNVLNTSK